MESYQNQVRIPTKFPSPGFEMLVVSLRGFCWNPGVRLHSKILGDCRTSGCWIAIAQPKISYPYLCQILKSILEMYKMTTEMVIFNWSYS